MSEVYEKKDRLNQLFDFYGVLLTSRQKEIFEMYNLNDFSLSEIGNSLEVTRNAVFDSLKKVETILEDYESKLNLVKNYTKRAQLIDDLKSHLDEEGIKIVEQLDRME